MGTTANRSYPYPDPTDPADFPQGMQDLAEAVDLDIQALVNSLVTIPFCVITRDTPQSVPFSGTELNLGYTTVNYDNDNMVNLAADNTSIYPTTAGLYFLHASVRCADVTTPLEMFLRVGGGGTDFGRTIHEGNALGQPRLTVSGLANLSAGDRVRATITQNTGSIINVYTPRLVALRVA
jgi:hypothetical protein